MRHAHADWTPDEDRPLSAAGREDANRGAHVLQQYPINMICASPFARARQTIAPLAARLDLPVHEMPDLRERQLSAGAEAARFGIFISHEISGPDALPPLASANPLCYNSCSMSP